MLHISVTNHLGTLFVVAVSSSDALISKSQIVPFDPTKKKKKKKITIVDPADEPVEKLAEKTENLSGMQNQTSNLLEQNF